MVSVFCSPALGQTAQSTASTQYRAATWQKAQMMRANQKMAHMRGVPSPRWPHSHCAGRCQTLVKRYKSARLRAEHRLAVYTKKHHPPLRQLSDWLCLHEHEGAWNATGFYEGGLQMDREFSHTYGGDMYVKYHGEGPYAWSPYDQITVAQRAYDGGRGYGPWPNTRIMCGI